MATSIGRGGGCRLAWRGATGLGRGPAVRRRRTGRCAPGRNPPRRVGRWAATTCAVTGRTATRRAVGRGTVMGRAAQRSVTPGRAFASEWATIGPRRTMRTAPGWAAATWRARVGAAVRRCRAGRRGAGKHIDGCPRLVDLARHRTGCREDRPGQTGLATVRADGNAPARRLVEVTIRRGHASTDGGGRCGQLAGSRGRCATRRSSPHLDLSLEFGKALARCIGEYPGGRGGVVQDQVSQSGLVVSRHEQLHLGGVTTVPSKEDGVRPHLVDAGA